MEKSTYLTFFLGNELFAVNVQNVLEVLEQQQITRVPQAPVHIQGIINFRGEILPVVNTHCKFNLPDTHELSKRYIIVFDLEKNDARICVSATVDGVKDVIEITEDEINPVPEMGLQFDANYIDGVIRKHEQFILLVNPLKVFSVSDATVLQSQPENLMQ
ncbi:MAG: chemotaxis protein CheW [Breznakibacter sp.]